MDSEAFIGVLACARAADSKYPDSEGNLLDLICRNHQFTRQLGTEAYLGAVAAIKARIVEVGWEAAISEYLARLPDDWGYSTLLSVIDICLVDADEHLNELTCIASIGDRFNISLEEINGHMKWFRIKNGILAELYQSS